MRSLLALFGLAVLLAPPAFAAAPKHATILFAGDDGGEVAPCG